LESEGELTAQSYLKWLSYLTKVIENTHTQSFWKIAERFKETGFVLENPSCHRNVSEEAG
jgi:hypothetical protein